MSETVVATGLHRTFGEGVRAVHALRDVSLRAAAGELTVVTGPSGAGKTTLLNIIAGLDRPQQGDVLVEGTSLGGLSEGGLVDLRRRRIGYVFQGFGLIPALTAAENVELPLRLAGTAVADRDARVAEVLDRVGLGPHARQRPDELSGGQQQRVGLARALVARPAILIADEPTGQLDSDTAAAVMDLVLELTREAGTATLLSTHDPLVAERADHVVRLLDGEVQA